MPEIKGLLQGLSVYPETRDSLSVFSITLVSSTVRFLGLLCFLSASRLFVGLVAEVTWKEFEGAGLGVTLLLLVNAGQGLVLVPEELLKLVGVPPVIRDVGEESPGLDLKWES